VSQPTPATGGPHDGRRTSGIGNVAAVGLSADEALPGNRGDRIEPDPTRARSPGWLFHAVFVVAALALVAVRSDTNRESIPALLVIAVLVVVAITWLVRLSIFVIRTRRGALSDGRTWFVVAPVVGCLVGALLLVDAPLRARWALSKDAFDAELERVVSDEESYGGGRLGWYDVLFSRTEGDGVIFFTKAHADEDIAGFAYLPTGLGDANQFQGFWEPQLVHLGGHWYAFEKGGYLTTIAYPSASPSLAPPPGLEPGATVLETAMLATTPQG
jgi:hypothetical protein